jgi:hypothetical protein
MKNFDMMDTTNERTELENKIKKIDVHIAQLTC